MALPLLAILGPMAAKGGMAAGAQGLEALPSLIPTRYDKLNKERLKRLEQLAANNALGLSTRQKQNIRQAIVNPSIKAVSDLQQSAPVQPGQSASESVLQRMANQQAYGQVQTQASGLADQAVREADQAKRQAQRGELEARTKQLSDRRSEQLAAALSIPMAGLGAGAEEYEQRITTGPGAFNELKKDTTAAQSLIEAYQNDPEMLDLILSFGMMG